MRVLVATLIKRTRERIYQYPAATESILGLRYHKQVDYFMPSGGDTGLDSIWRKYEEARRVALIGGYDALLCAESDMVLPPDTLEKMQYIDADIIYGLYTFRNAPHQWNVCTYLDRFTFKFLSDNVDKAREAWGKVIRCAGVGQGCTLIRRNVLESVPFRYAPTAGVDHLHALEAAEQGFSQVCDTTIICGHITHDGVLYPTNEGDLWRISR